MQWFYHSWIIAIIVKEIKKTVQQIKNKSSRRAS